MIWLACLPTSPLWAAEPATLADLQALAPAVLTRAELLALMPGREDGPGQRQGQHPPLDQ